MLRWLMLAGLLALAGCAAQTTFDLQPAPPETARFAVPELLPQRALRELRRGSAPNNRSAAEQFRFETGFAEVQKTYAGSKLTQEALAATGGREAIETWARGLRFERSLTEVLAAERVVHERFRGDGWLLRFATSQPGVECAAGRAYFAINTISDDRGFTFDTTLAALFCHPAGRGEDVAALFRRLPAPRP
jgi:hypothetical protein